MFQDGRTEEKRQELLAATKSGTIEDIRHVLLGTSSDTTAKIMPYLSARERLAWGKITTNIDGNPNINRDDKDRLLADLETYFSESDTHTPDINFARIGGSIGTAMISVGLALPIVAGTCFVKSQQLEDEIAALEANADLYMQNKRQALEYIFTRCEKGHVESEVDRIQNDVKQFMEEYRADPAREKTLTIHVNPQTEGDLRHCAQENLMGTHKGQLQNTQGVFKRASYFFLLAALGMGFGGGRLRKNAQKEVEGAENKLMALRADPFPKPKEGLDGGFIIARAP